MLKPRDSHAPSAVPSGSEGRALGLPVCSATSPPLLLRAQLGEGSAASFPRLPGAPLPAAHRPPESQRQGVSPTILCRSAPPWEALTVTELLCSRLKR